MDIWIGTEFEAIVYLEFERPEMEVNIISDLWGLPRQKWDDLKISGLSGLNMILDKLRALLMSHV